MDLDPVSAHVGWKISGDRARDAPNWLSNEDDYRFAVDRVVDNARCARSQEVVLELFNLVCHLLA